MKRLERSRRSWLCMAAAMLLGASAGAGIGDGTESVTAHAAETAAAATPVTAPAPGFGPATAETTGVETVTRAETTGAGESLPAPADTSPAPVSAAGVRAFVDPATGKLTTNPTRAQLQSLALQARSASWSRSVVGLRPFELSRGGRGLDLQGRFQTALRVERGEDGNFYQTCGDPGHDREPHSHPLDSTTDHAGGSRRSEPAPVQ